MNKTDFANTFYPLAKTAGEKYNINPIVILAQAAHESGWGDSYAVRNRKNFFGITAYGPTNQYWDGAKSTSSVSGIPFRIYKTYLDSFYDFARLISEKYKSAAKVSFEPEKYAKAIAYSPYISEANGDNRPLYEKAIIDNSKFFNGILAPQLLKDAEEKKKKKIITIVVFSVIGLLILSLVIYLIYKYKK